MADVTKIAVFPLEFVEEYRDAHAGQAPPQNLAYNQACGIARIGDSKPPNLLAGGRRLPRIPAQFVVIGYDAVNNEVPDIRNGRKLDNGNTVVLTWRAELVNQRTEGWIVWPGDSRLAGDTLVEVATPGVPAPNLGFQIDDTGLLTAGGDGYFTHAFPSGAKHLDRTCDGYVKVKYQEKTPANALVNELNVQGKAVIGPPDWSASRDDTPAKQWHWP